METLTVQLTQGKTAIIDACDEWVLRWKWNASRGTNDWYAKRTDYGNGKKKDIFLHRLILSDATAGEHPEMFADHRNGDTLDCRRSNLRWANYSQSARNQGLMSDNVSGIRGVSWHKHARKWHAKIRLHGLQIHLGLFTSLESAAQARLEAAKLYHGDFASEVSRVR